MKILSGTVMVPILIMPIYTVHNGVLPILILTIICGLLSMYTVKLIGRALTVCKTLSYNDCMEILYGRTVGLITTITLYAQLFGSIVITNIFVCKLAVIAMQNCKLLPNLRKNLFIGKMAEESGNAFSGLEISD